jgi:hypothetical protein
MPDPVKRRLLPDDPDWELTEQIDPETYELTNTYYFRGKPAKRTVLTSPVARQICGYVLIERDLRNVVEWFAAVKDRIISQYGESDVPKRPVKASGPEFNMTKALFVSAIAFYGKLFTTAEGRKVSLQETWIEESSLKVAHKELMSSRHNFTAHSGTDSGEYVNLIVATRRVSRKDVAITIATELKQPVAPTPEQIDLFIRLAEHLRTLVATKIRRLHEKLDIGAEVRIDD